MRILVTGSAGLVGRALVDALRSAGHEALGLDIRASGGDIRDPDAVARAIAGCDGVIHLAAISRVAWGEADPALCHSVNVDGTATVLDAAARSLQTRWIVFASSREVYGDPEVLPVTEAHPVRPVNHYGRSKALGERIVEAARSSGLRTAIVRLSNVYGTEYDHPDRAVPALLWRAMCGSDLQITGSDHFFDFVHVSDCVTGLLAVSEALAAGSPSPRPVHLVTGVRTSLDDLARAACRVSGSPSQIARLPARKFDVAGFVGDPARARSDLGWTAAVPLDEGLARLRDMLAARGAPPDPVTLSDLVPSRSVA